MKVAKIFCEWRWVISLGTISYSRYGFGNFNPKISWKYQDICDNQSTIFLTVYAFSKKKKKEKVLSSIWDFNLGPLLVSFFYSLITIWHLEFIVKIM